MTSKYAEETLLIPWLVALSFILGIWTLDSRADGPASCPKPQSTKDILKCVVERSPETIRARLAVESNQAQQGAAAQLSNPTLSIQSGFLNPSGKNGADHQLSLTQPIDLGGKRGSRVEEASARAAITAAEEVRIKNQVVTEVLLKLNRIRQITSELRILEETRDILKRLSSLYLKRPSLTPEQEVSLAVFKAAQQELELRHLSLNEELSTYEAFFSVSTGLSLAELTPVLPPVFSPWPSLPKRELDLASPVLFRAEAERKLSLAALSSARANAWPELSLGPYAQIQRDGATKSTLLGVAATLEIPIFSLNGGGRAAAHKGLLVAERNVELTKKEETSEFERLSKVYESSVGTLSKLSSLESQEKEHLRLERLFVRGVVPSALVIESHRQLLDLSRSRNERELKAMEAWWKLQALQGKLLETAL